VPLFALSILDVSRAVVQGRVMPITNGAVAAATWSPELPDKIPSRGWAVIWLLPLLLTSALPQAYCGVSLPLQVPGWAALDRAQLSADSVQFDNGLRVVCVENPATQTIALSAFITTAARAEVASNAGIRSFVAQAVVDCGAHSQTRAGETMDQIGAEAYVGAGLDFTEITLLAAAEDLEPAAKLLRDILFGVQFAEERIGRLRRQLAANLARADELPETAAELAAAVRLYPNHPFGWPPEGLAASVSGITVDQVERFHEGSYVANNMVIVAAGGVAVERCLAALDAAFRSALPGKRLPETAGDPRPSQTGRDELQRQGSTAVVYVGARAPGVSDPGYAPAAVALAVMGSGLHSRLYHALRREAAIAYTVEVGAMTARAGARAGVLVACPPSLAAEAERRMVREIRRMATELASPEEIRRATEYICTSYALNHQRSADLAHQLGAFEVTADQGYALHSALPGLIRQATPEAVRQAASTMFSRTVTVRVLPS
jgi:predicted Zn-dependent peptidase